MDKETLLRLAQPAATCLLALSILSLPLMTKADLGGLGGSWSNALLVRVRGCD